MKVPDHDGMADAPYLVALALFDQGDKRAMPLAGKSQAVVAAAGDAPNQLGKELALDLLLRVWQRSDDGPLARAAAVNSLVLVELPFVVVKQDKLTLLMKMARLPLLLFLILVD